MTLKSKKTVQITRRGKVIAVVQPSSAQGPDPKKFWDACTIPLPSRLTGMTRWEGGLGGM